MIGMGLVAPPPESDTRNRILVAAASLFGERGYASTSLRVIATAVGMTPPALYWYFPSKQAILHALLHSALFDFLDAVEAEVVGPSPEDRLRQFVRAHVQKGALQPRIGGYEAPFGVRHMAQFLPEAERAELIAGQRRHLDLLRDTLREGMRLGCFRELDVTATAFAIVSMCDYVNSWWKPGGRIDVEELASLYEELAMRMVRARPEDPAPPGPPAGGREGRGRLRATRP
jgi:TetR/AcrR family transcriptional regulator, cholesterol catabolism regulator